jgi:hypothetical protein
MYTYEEPILALRLVHFNLTLRQQGFYWVAIGISYVPVSILVTLVPKKIERRVLISSSLLAIGIGFSLVGPSLLLQFPDWLYIMSGGLILVFTI